MAVIKQDDLIQSVADALQYISYYHPVDFIQAVHEAYQREESQAARDAMAQILINSRMCATGHRPICQDTGIVTVFARVGMDVRWDGATMSLDDMINEGVRRAYNLPENVLRASILADPAGKRANTKDNTPAVIHYQIVPGDKVEIDVAVREQCHRCARLLEESPEQEVEHPEDEQDEDLLQKFSCKNRILCKKTIESCHSRTATLLFVTPLRRDARSVSWW